MMNNNNTWTPVVAAQWCRNENWSGEASPGKDSADILMSIDSRLSSLDARLCFHELMHKEFQALRESLEFSQQQMQSLREENALLSDTVKSLMEGFHRVTEENKKTKEAILNLQARSMRNNLVFAGIAEEEQEDPEKTVKNFLKARLKLPEETVESISFHRVHRLGGKNPNAHHPRPIIAKFFNYKEKEQVKSRGLELKDFSVNDQFPKEILDRRRILSPICRILVSEGHRAVIAVDKLYVNGQLYRDQSMTPWLF